MNTRTAGNTSDEDLLKRSNGGDRAAFEHLYDRYWKKLVWFARGFTVDAERAEDVVQEVFIKLIEKPGSYDPGKRFSTWIYTVTANHCRNLLRNESNRSRILSQLEVPVAGLAQDGGTYDRKLLRQKLEEAVAKLNEKEKKIYVLRFDQEESIKEIATILDLPEGTVKSGIFHLLKKIANHLKAFTDATR